MAWRAARRAAIDNAEAFDARRCAITREKEAHCQAIVVAGVPIDGYQRTAAVSRLSRSVDRHHPRNLWERRSESNRLDARAWNGEFDQTRDCCVRIGCRNGLTQGAGISV